jgi:hypothetical protein
MDNQQYRPLPIKLQEFQKIVIYLRNILNCELNDNIFTLAKNIRDNIKNSDINNELTEYDITYKCIQLINNQYINKYEEP